MIHAAFFRSCVRRARIAALLPLLVAASVLADGSGDGSSVFPMFTNDIEGSLVRTVLALRDRGLKQALGEIDAAVAHSPNYRLAYMIQGDLLMARAGNPVAFGVPNGAAASSVASLQDEARVRVHRYLDAPPVAALPAPLLQLAPSQAHALLVDTSRSRLFVYANDHGKPRYVTDFYISLGKNGIEKQREGDQKTPIGVYTVIASRDKLPDFYGIGAYPISYPNEWDRLNGRNGHGIWLHGTPSETYSRPPWATDGCLVLTNDDFTRLARFVDVSRTPVVIGPGLQWRDNGRWQEERDSFFTAFASWRTDWESRDTTRYLSHYSQQFRSEHGDFAAWKAAKSRVNAGKTWVKIAANDVGVFAYPGRDNMVLVTFEQDYRSNNLSSRKLKRQYWVRESGRWRIVHEATVS